MQTRPSLTALALALVVTVAPALAASVSDMDRSFLVEMQETNLAEIVTAKYAIAHSDSPRINNYALTIEGAHETTLKDIAIYARGANVELPTEPSSEQAAQARQLEKLSGNAFDTAYLKAQIAGHETAVSLARQEARYGSDANIASLARQLVSPLEYHLHLATSTLASLQNPVQSGELSPPRGN